MAEIISGKNVSQKMRDELKTQISEFSTLSGHTPALAVIVVGDDPASAVYVRNKHKACLETGIRSLEFAFSSDITEDKLLSKIEELNYDSSVDGILVQLPLPSHINEERVIQSILPEKDVDAFHPVNVGKISIGSYNLLPCTPAGVMQLLAHYNVEIKGKRCVVIGRSNIVGKPMAMLLLEKHGTVTVCHSKTVGLSDITRKADIIVVAIGRAKFLTADMVKAGAVVIDVGINRTSEGKLVGDVDFDEVSKVASLITPVPGGVGPMTITMLLKNTFSAAVARYSQNN